MSVANPKTPEPSMEEILASIRRIIADDQELAKVPETETEPESDSEPAPEPAAAGEAQPTSFDRASPAAGPEPEEDILDLADLDRPARSSGSPIDDTAPDISFREIDPGQVEFDAMAEEPVAVAPAVPAPPITPPPAPSITPSPAPEPVKAASARETPASRFSGGGEHLMSRTTDASVGHAFNLLAHTVLSSNARTLEDLVREMLRPMLKEWLDDNLPTVVERLVRAEIERVARGGR